jgi:hypothetical protein
VSCVSPSTEKELPHPQLFPALGLSILNPACIPSPVKSITAPLTYFVELP